MNHSPAFVVTPVRGGVFAFAFTKRDPSFQPHFLGENTLILSKFFLNFPQTNIQTR